MECAHSLISVASSHVVRGRWRFDSVGNVDQVLAKGPQAVLTHVTAQDDVAILGHGDDQVWEHDPAFLEPPTDKRVGFAEHLPEDMVGSWHHSDLRAQNLSALCSARRAAPRRALGIIHAGPSALQQLGASQGLRQPIALAGCD